MFHHPQQTQHFFLYRVPYGAVTFDQRCPDGGLVVKGHSDVEIAVRAFTDGYRRFPCHPHEMIVLVPVGDKTRQRQTELMAQDWERAFQSFEELMTVGT